MNDAGYWTCGQLARLLGVNRMSLYRWCRTGKLKALQLPSGRYRIHVDDVEKLLGCKPPPPPK